MEPYRVDGRARALTYTQQPVEASELLPSLPKLVMPSGDAWQRNVVLMACVKEVVLACTTIVYAKG